jgi:hypothetical protein
MSKSKNMHDVGPCNNASSRIKPSTKYYVLIGMGDRCCRRYQWGGGGGMHMYYPVVTINTVST